MCSTPPAEHLALALAAPRATLRDVNAPGQNPYAAPIASGGVVPDALDAHMPRWWSVGILAFLFGAMAGLLFVEEAILSLQRFGGVEYVPRLLLLRATREAAGGPAAIAVELLGVSALHRMANAATERSWQLARWPLIATVAATVPSYGGMLLAAVMASMAHGISPSLYTEAARTTLSLTDPLVGLTFASVGGAAASAVLYVGRRAWMSTKWPLAAKWIVAFLALQLGRAGLGALVWLAA